LRSWKAAVGSSSERGKRGKGKRERGHKCGAPWGVGRLQEGRHGEGLQATAATCMLSVVRERTGREEGEKEEREKKKKRKEKKRNKIGKKYEKNFKLENFRGEK
jgi:hypothetical protein